MAALIQFVPAMIVIIFLGFLLRRIGFLKEEDVNLLNKIIIYLALPAMIFLAVRASKPALSLAKIPLLGLVVMTLCLLVAILAGRLLRLPAKTLGAFLIASAMGNTGYLGFPLTIGVFGERNLVKAVFYDFGTVVFIFTAGVIIAKMLGEGDRKGGILSVLKEFLLFPSTVALVLGLLLLPVPLPKFLLGSLTYLSQATIPLIMLTIGLSLKAEGFSKYALPLSFLVVIKLILSPFFAYWAGSLAGFAGQTLGVFVLEASMPAVMLSLVIGLKYKLDVHFLPSAILVSTIASLVTIPLGQALLNLL